MKLRRALRTFQSWSPKVDASVGILQWIQTNCEVRDRCGSERNLDE